MAGSFLFDQELRPLNPTTFNFEPFAFTALDCLLTDGFFALENGFFALEDGFFALENGFFALEEGFLELLGPDSFTDLDTLIPGFADLVGANVFLVFDPWAGDDFSESAFILLLCLATFINFSFFPFCSVILDLALSLRTLFTERDSRLSFFLIASSIRVARTKSFLATKLVTFPVKKGRKLCILTSLDKYEQISVKFWALKIHDKA